MVETDTRGPAKRVKSPKSGKLTDSLQRYADAYAAGIVDVAGGVFTPPTDGHARYVFRSVLKVHARGDDGKPLTGDALVAWIRTSAAEYRRSRGERAAYEGGFKPGKWQEWLDGGRAAIPVAREARAGAVAKGGKCAQAYERGIRSTGNGFGAISAPHDLDALGVMVDEFAKDAGGSPLVGNDRLPWVEATAREFRATADPRYAKNFSPVGCLGWLQSGKLSAKAPGNKGPGWTQASSTPPGRTTSDLERESWDDEDEETDIEEPWAKDQL